MGRCIAFQKCKRCIRGAGHSKQKVCQDWGHRYLRVRLSRDTLDTDVANFDQLFVQSGNQ